jgi:hypothetical protein
VFYQGRVIGMLLNEATRERLYQLERSPVTLGQLALPRWSNDIFHLIQGRLVEAVEKDWYMGVCCARGEKEGERKGTL